MKTRSNKYIENVMSEVMRRMKAKGLRLIISLGPRATWSEFEKKWKVAHPKESYFLSRYKKPK